MHARLAVRPSASRPRTIPGLLAAMSAGAIDVFYVLLIRSQGPAGPVGPDWFRVAFLAGVLAFAALALVVGTVVRRPQLRAMLLGAGAVVCWAWAILAIFSKCPRCRKTYVSTKPGGDRRLHGRHLFLGPRGRAGSVRVPGCFA